MEFRQQDVDYVARLARLGLTREEAEKFSRQLRDILAYAGKLNQLDVKSVEPTSHVLPLANVFREDEIKPGLPAEKALANAPDLENNFFRVPRVIE